MLNRTRPKEELGTRRCMKKHPRKHSELKEPYEMLNKKNKKTIARQKKAKEKALK